jgi:hypothetical protein
MSVDSVCSIFFKDGFYTIYGNYNVIGFDLNQPDTFSTTSSTASSTAFIKDSRAYSAYSG